MEERLVSRDVDAEGSVDSIKNHFVNVSRHQKLTQQCYWPDLKKNYGGPTLATKMVLPLQQAP